MPVSGASKGWRLGGRYALLTVLAIAVLFPIYVMVIGALKPGNKLLVHPLLPTDSVGWSRAKSSSSSTRRSVVDSRTDPGGALFAPLSRAQEQAGAPDGRDQLRRMCLGRASRANLRRRLLRSIARR